MGKDGEPGNLALPVIGCDLGSSFHFLGFGTSIWTMRRGLGDFYALGTLELSTPTFKMLPTGDPLVQLPFPERKTKKFDTAHFPFLKK